jgi:hypothetical protein
MQMHERQERNARTEATFREMNEWTREANNGRVGKHRQLESYLCECSDRLCTDPISMSRIEYEAVRSEPIRFAISLNHENPEVDRVVAENERFATIHKLYGDAVRVARETNPRR